MQAPHHRHGGLTHADDHYGQCGCDSARHAPHGQRLGQVCAQDLRHQPRRIVLFCRLHAYQRVTREHHVPPHRPGTRHLLLCGGAQAVAPAMPVLTLLPQSAHASQPLLTASFRSWWPPGCGGGDFCSRQPHQQRPHQSRRHLQHPGALLPHSLLLCVAFALLLPAELTRALRHVTSPLLQCTPLAHCTTLNAAPTCTCQTCDAGGPCLPAALPLRRPAKQLQGGEELACRI